MSSAATATTSVLYPCSTDGKLDYTKLSNYPECVTGLFWLSHDYKSDGINANKFGEKTESSPTTDGKYYGINSKKCLFDPSRKTIIYVHGWQQTLIKNKIFTVLPPSIVNFITDGWNVGIFRWQSFSDDDDTSFTDYNSTVPVVTESKIYSKNFMRYRNANGIGFVNIPHVSPTSSPYSNKNMTDIFVEEYAKYFGESTSKYTGSEIRFVGHSLGTQLVVNAARQINESTTTTTTTTTTPNYKKVNRIDLLDAFFCNINKKDAQDKFGYNGLSGAQKTVDNVNKLNPDPAKLNVAISWFQCTALTNITPEKISKDILGLDSVILGPLFQRAVGDMIFSDSNDALKTLVAYQCHKFWYLPLTNSFSDIFKKLLNSNECFSIKCGFETLMSTIVSQTNALHNEMIQWYFNSYIIKGDSSKLSVYNYNVEKISTWWNESYSDGNTNVNWRLISPESCGQAQAQAQALSSMNTIDYIKKNMLTKNYWLQMSMEQLDKYYNQQYIWFWGWKYTGLYISNGKYSLKAGTATSISSLITNDSSTDERLDINSGGNYTKKIGDDIFTLQQDVYDNEWNNFFFYNTSSNKSNGVPVTSSIQPFQKSQ